MKKKLIKGKDYDGWVWKWDTWENGEPCTIGDVAYTFEENRRDVTQGLSEKHKRWARRKGRRLVKAKLVEVRE